MEQVSAKCPECGSEEIEVGHRDGDLALPECSWLFCLDCDWRSDPE